MIVILLNGPPGSGKDTISNMLNRWASTHIREEKFATPIKRAIPAAFDLGQGKWAELDSSVDSKARPSEELFNTTARNVQIAFSETFIKPLLGQDAFGRMLVRRLSKLQSTYESAVISDSGFLPEARVVVEHFGKDKVFLWRIQRDGCSYEGDSRGYISLKSAGVHELEITNNGTPEYLRTMVVGAYKSCTLTRENYNGAEPETHEQWQSRLGLAIQRWKDSYGPR